MHSGQGLGETGNRCNQYCADFANIAADEKANEGLHVGVDAPSFLDGRHDRGKVVVRKDHICGLLGNFRPRYAHRNPDRGLLQSGCIIDPVPSHGRNLSLALQHLDELLLVGRLGPAEHHVTRLDELELLLLWFLEELPPLVRLDLVS